MKLLVLVFCFLPLVSMAQQEINLLVDWILAMKK